MRLFIDRHNRRKSPLALAAFGAALLYLCVYGVLYALLAEPLYRHVRLSNASAWPIYLKIKRGNSAPGPVPSARRKRRLLYMDGDEESDD